MSPKTPRVAAVAVFSAIAGHSAAVLAGATRAEIEISMNEDGASLDGNVVFTIANDTGDGIREIALWLYPNRLAVPNPGLDARTSKWIYPAGASAAAMRVGRPTWNGRPLGDRALRLSPMPPGGTPRGARDVIARVRLPEPLAPGTSGALGLGFHVDVPERAGRFGRRGGVTTLAGGWFPVPAADLVGDRLDRPPEAVAADITMRLPAGRGAVIHDRVFRPSGAARVVKARGVVSEAVTLVVMDAMDVTETTASGVSVSYVSRDARPRPASWRDTRGPAETLPSGLPDPAEIDAPGRALGVAAGAIRIFAGLSPGMPLPQRLVIVETPARDRLAQGGCGAVVVSNRLYRLFPIESAMRFHDLAVAREVAAEIALSALRRREPPDDRMWIADVLGSLVAERYSAEVHREAESVEDIVGFAAFLPVIDNLIYAPQIPFREVYFAGVEESDPLRDEPWRFMTRRPRGRRVLGKLEDLLGESEVRALVSEYLAGSAGIEEILARRIGGDATWFFEEWLSDYPEVNYRLGRAWDERRGDSVLHHAEVIREGETIREPVVVRFTDEDGRTADARWEGEGQRGVVDWESRAPIDRVEIDPEHRLVQSARLTAGHPLEDDASSQPWRPPLLNKLVLWYDVNENEPTLELGLTMRQRYDVTNSVAAAGQASPRGYGASLGYYRHFGLKRTLNDREYALGPSIGVYRYRPEDDALAGLPDSAREGALVGSIGLGMGRDDRSYFWDPARGTACSTSLRYSFGRADDGRDVHVGTAALRLFGLWSPAIHHTLALYGGALGIVGDPVAAQLVSLSDRQILRGFDSDETYGRLGFYAVAEYRHTLASPGDLQIASVGWLDRLQGALFAAGGTMSEPGSYSAIFSEERLYAEAGYGLRFHWLVAGAVQYLLALDLAVPLHPRERERIADDGTGTPRDPIKLIFGITQTY